MGKGDCGAGACMGAFLQGVSALARIYGRGLVIGEGRGHHRHVRASWVAELSLRGSSSRRRRGCWKEHSCAALVHGCRGRLTGWAAWGRLPEFGMICVGKSR